MFAVPVAVPSELNRDDSGRGAYDSSDYLGRAGTWFGWPARDPVLQVAPFDLNGSLELHVLELTAVASAVHDRRPHLQQRADLADREQAVVGDRIDRWRQWAF